jgi:AbrB family looped-hinge helix DNA binding protein
MKVTSKGQVTIPKAIRDECGLLPGTEVDFFRDNGAVKLVKVEADRARGKEIVEHLREAGRRGNFTMTTDEIMRLTRGED